MIEAGVQRWITLQVGDVLPGGLWFVTLPDKPKAYPVATLQLISSVPEYTLDGPTGLVKARLQIDHFGTDYLSCKTAAAAFRQILDGYKGTLPDGTQVSSMTRLNATDSFESDSRLYHTQTDWSALYDDPFVPLGG